jgi:hypothetical protein
LRIVFVCLFLIKQETKTISKSTEVNDTAEIGPAQRQKSKKKNDITVQEPSPPSLRYIVIDGNNVAIAYVLTI